MLYLGHFSFSFSSKPRRKTPQPWHGNFTAVAEAKDVQAALKKFEKIILKSLDGSELFADVKEIFLESCVELKSVPPAGFLAHVALEEGESLGSISTTLPSVNRKYATSYHIEPESTDDEDGSYDAEPFIVLKKSKPAKAEKPAKVEQPAKAAKAPKAKPAKSVKR